MHRFRMLSTTRKHSGLLHSELENVPCEVRLPLLEVEIGAWAGIFDVKQHLGKTNNINCPSAHILEGWPRSVLAHGGCPIGKRKILSSPYVCHTCDASFHYRLG